MDAHTDSALARWSPLAGLLFVAGVASILANPAVDDEGDNVAATVAHAAAHPGWIEWNVVVAVLVVPVLAVFVAGLVAATRGEAGAGTALTAVAGTLMTVLIVVSLLLWSAPLLEIANEPASTQRTQAAVYLAIEDVGWAAFIGFGAAAGTTILAFSYAAWKVELLAGRWAAASAVLGLVGGVTTAGFVGLFVLLAWILAVSLFLLVRGRRAAVAGRPATASR